MLAKTGSRHRRWMFLVAVLLSACAQQQPPLSVKFPVQEPALYPATTKLKDVAVLAFDGTDGKIFSSEVEAAIASIEVNQQPYYRLIERQKIDQAIAEAGFGQSGMVTENTAAKIGKMVGAKGIYVGTVRGESGTVNYSETRTECLPKYQAKNGKCKKRGERQTTVTCIQTAATFAFTPKLIDVESGRIVYARTVNGSAQSRSCPDQGGPPQQGFELQEKARRDALRQFKAHIAPSSSLIQVNVDVVPDGISSSSEETKFNQGVQFARDNRMDRACEVWAGLAPKSKDAIPAMYNLGLCAEMEGDQKVALQLYEKVDHQLPKSEERVTEALSRVKTRIENENKLAEETK